MSAEVFISYASKDRKRILDLVDRLESAGVSVWIDQMSIEGATMWSQEIADLLRKHGGKTGEELKAEGK